MSLELLSIAPQYLVEDTELDRMADISPEFSEARDSELEKCIREDKWYLSERKKHDVGEGFAEEHFMDYIFPGWDDGFRAGYFSPAGSRDSENDKHAECNNPNFFQIQVIALSKFIEKFRMKHGENSEMDFYERYSRGWMAGFRAGFCGGVCSDRDNCEIADKYFLVMTLLQNMGNDVY